MTGNLGSTMHTKSSTGKEIRSSIFYPQAMTLYNGSARNA